MDIQSNAVLVLIDMQKGINHPKLGRRNNPHAELQMLRLLALWRATERPVIHVRHFSRSPDSVFWPEQSGVDYQPEFLPVEGEREWQKQTPDAFCGTSLESELRTDSISQIVIVGVVTNNSVESTARSGGNLGFDVLVVHDACFTFDQPDFFGNPHTAEEVHAMSLGNLHGEYATVVATNEVLDALGRWSRLHGAVSKNTGQP
ncbi:MULTISPECIES: cysteine hydrolase family protein [unclassified Pseudomonas]|uniref:cysteine hydrolase family protein n=1 Tax=unclassified Pseudomonas TaxID=196821 RepID=UPI002AC9C6F7|nr:MULTISPECIES: cysteine hydrolase family protein [unclassified Pseudomonas]MEB0040117.1 cysteine hydrolase family protein [Pseudomonas sp. MH10]MEB0123909.1 cysteine hydrolase family protein [Pseudomonas sp. CCI1.2]WPX65455.1 cysteine hydrolase family protein [Pseudomonas sp. MH10]